MINIDVEIAFLTKEYLVKLKQCTCKDQFKSLVEDFNDKKQKLIKENNIDYSDGKTSYWWYYNLFGSYDWLVSNYVYLYPDCDLDLFPDILRCKCEKAMYAIAVTHRDRLDWFRSSITLEDGTRYKSSISSRVRSFINKCTFENDCVINKKYLGDNVFIIGKWYKRYDFDIAQACINRLCFSFEEFANELQNDLSNAELYDFDITKIDLNKYITSGMSSIYLKAKDVKKEIPKRSFKKRDIDLNNILNIERFSTLEDNEDTNITLSNISSLDMYEMADTPARNTAFYYISDLHLCHILARNNVDSYDGIKHTLRQIAKSIKDSLRSYTYEILSFGCRGKILFVGDISSDRCVYELFLRELYRAEIKDAVFVLGNHDYWDFTSIEDAVAWYKHIAQKYGYICLHNELLLYNDIDKSRYESIIDTNTILNKSKEELVKLTEHARYIILGGTGFAGVNEKFNANNGIYRKCLGDDTASSRAKEISESLKIERIYSVLFEALSDRQIIICTHNPLYDWSIVGYWPNWIYVSGHTHRNERTVNENTRLYADNQIGYKSSNIKLKYFAAKTKNSLFDHYKDGIYVITGSSYQSFMDGRNIRMTLNYRDNKIWMLKRSGYYLFMLFRETKGKITEAYVYDGGRKKKVETHDPEYFWENMPRVISSIDDPLIRFSKITSKVSNYVKSFGGSGRIHGYIVDIDGFNHLYINPVDLKVTAYYAPTVNERYVYSDLNALLEDHCPNLYDTYQNTILKEKNKVSYLSSSIRADNIMQYDQGTNMYKDSNRIKRLDLLRADKILTNWIEISSDNPLISES